MTDEAAKDERAATLDLFRAVRKALGEIEVAYLTRPRGESAVILPARLPKRVTSPEAVSYPVWNQQAMEEFATASVLADRAQAVALGAREPTWRCFHCDETFTNTSAAREHFGPHEFSLCGCVIDLAKYREMEETLNRWQSQGGNDEEYAHENAIHSMQADHHTALIREEEKGYAKGLADGRALDATPTASLRQGEAWISCAERMPDEHVPVLALDSEGEMLVGWASYWHGASNGLASWVFPLDLETTVTHWMPLPAPPIATSPIELSVDRVLRGPLAVGEGRLNANERTALAGDAEGKLEAPLESTAGSGEQDHFERDVAIDERTAEHGRKDRP